VKISELLAKEIEKETFARAQKYYSFIVLDPPIAPDIDKKVKPKRANTFTTSNRVKTRSSLEICVSI
jgi:hypothetical protein